MALKLRKRSLFPAIVVANSPILLTKVGAKYTFGFDASQAPTGPAGPQGPSGSAGAGYGGTSSTSLLIANLVTKTFVTQAGLAYQVGNYVRAASTSAPANFMEGYVSGYSGTSLSINVINIGGSGTFADWVLSLSGSAGSTGVASLNGQTGALVNYYQPQGRVTLASGVPVMASSQAACTTVYYTPYAGNIVPIYDGTNMIPTVVAEVSQATTDATKSPAAVAASKIYDLFVWNDSGTIRCTRGPAWTNATTRGYTLTMVSGILLNTSLITNGPAASRGTYVGTIASNAASSIDFIFGGAGSSGVAGVFNVWNAYNRRLVGCRVIDTSAAYTYTSSTIRQAHASTSMQVSFVVGLAEDSLAASAQLSIFTVAVISAFAKIGVQLDGLTTFDSNGICFTGSAASVYQVATAISTLNPAAGTHVLSMNESGDGSNANNFNQDGVNSKSGLSYQFMM
jgi:hypothetical protein